MGATQLISGVQKSSHYFPPRRILLPVDGSENSKRAADAAVSLAKGFDSELVIIYVIPLLSFLSTGPVGYSPVLQRSYDEYYMFQQDQGKRLVDNVISLARNQNVKAIGETVKSSSQSIISAILEKAKLEKVDLIVMGTRGLGGFSKLVLGSVSSGVLAHSTCNVLLVK